jgi:2-iminobutanoate/2-iminopropanoate deaminase
MIPFRSSAGILAGDTLHVSGEIGVDLHMREIPKDFDGEVKTCLDDMGMISKAAGRDYSDVVSAQVFRTDMTQFKRLNAVYAAVFN